MEIHYCDLCSNPMKDEQSWILYIASPESMNEALENRDDVSRYIHKVEREQKEICPACKHLFDRIFYHRLQGMAALTEECIEMFNLPPYEKKIPEPIKKEPFDIEKLKKAIKDKKKKGKK